jgi:hypothetical protein
MTERSRPPQVWTFDALVREGTSLIPAHAPTWTNHNPSDPGITLVELLAYFTEVLVYRIGRITPQAKLQFLRLLKGGEWTGWKALADDLDRAADRAPAEAIDRAIDAAVRDLSGQFNAVTAGDFEQLAMVAAQQELGTGTPVRTLCVLGAPARSRSARDHSAHVTVIVVPQREIDKQASAQLCAAVHARLAPQCLLGTRLHVAGPAYVHVAIDCKLVSRPGLQARAVRANVAAELERRFGPWAEGAQTGDRCEAGGRLDLNAITRLIDNTEGVDFVEDLRVLAISHEADDLGSPNSALGVQIGLHSTPGVDTWLGTADFGQRLQRDDAGRLVALRMEPWEVLRLHLVPGDGEAGDEE